MTAVDDSPSPALQVDEVGARVERLLDDLGAADPAVAEIGERLVRELLALYGAGLARILDHVASGAPEVLGVLAGDPLVAGLLALHDLHPVDLTTRVEQALDGVRPYLGSHGGDVTVLGIDDDVVRLRLEGSCDGCGSSEATLRYAVEGAIREAAPEIERIEVEGVTAGSNSDPATAPTTRGNAQHGAFVPVSALTMRRDVPPPEAWVALEQPVPAAAVDAPAQVREVAGARVVLCRAGEDLVAYADPCPSCGQSLDGAHVDGDVLACPGCGRRYDVRLAGRALDGDLPPLAPVPLVEDADGVRLAAGALR